MKKRLLSIMLVAAMVGVMVMGCSQKADNGDSGDASDSGDSDLITVGYAQVGAESDWRTANTESFKSTFTKENGYELIFDDAQ